MRIFDTHAHYKDHDYDSDREQVIKKIKDTGVDRVCEISACLDDVYIGKSFADKYNKITDDAPKFYYAAGVHPDEVKNFEYDSPEFNDYFSKLESFIKNENKPVAIGEIGLDYYGDKTDEKKLNQKLWFIEQIKLAKKYDLPLVIHSRDACKDTMDIMKEYANNYHGIIHCFSYELDIAKAYVDMGYYIGIGGVCTFKNGRKLVEVIEGIDVSRLLTETDAPYLSPVPHRGERNDSSNIDYVLDKMSITKDIDKEKLAQICYQNALDVYNIKEA